MSATIPWVFLPLSDPLNLTRLHQLLILTEVLLSELLTKLVQIGILQFLDPLDAGIVKSVLNHSKFSLGLLELSLLPRSKFLFGFILELKLMFVVLLDFLNGASLVNGELLVELFLSRVFLAVVAGESALALFNQLLCLLACLHQALHFGQHFYNYIFIHRIKRLN